jgi:hypothetical protein
MRANRSGAAVTRPALRRRAVTSARWQCRLFSELMAEAARETGQRVPRVAGGASACGFQPAPTLPRKTTIGPIPAAGRSRRKSASTRPAPQTPCIAFPPHPAGHSADRSRTTARRRGGCWGLVYIRAVPCVNRPQGKSVEKESCGLGFGVRRKIPRQGGNGRQGQIPACPCRLTVVDTRPSAGVAPTEGG